jgi:hypothetical protein
MEATYSSETSVDFPEDRTLHEHRCENLESYKF